MLTIKLLLLTVTDKRMTVYRQRVRHRKTETQLLNSNKIYVPLPHQMSFGRNETLTLIESCQLEDSPFRELTVEGSSRWRERSECDGV
jgi:hypothetical protein